MTGRCHSLSRDVATHDNYQSGTVSEHSRYRDVFSDFLMRSCTTQHASENIALRNSSRHGVPVLSWAAFKSSRFDTLEQWERSTTLNLTMMTDSDSVYDDL